jgi:hypothetical protein
MSTASDDLSEDDRKENEHSLMHGFRLLSVYCTRAGDKLWIITESDRSVTTLLSRSILGPQDLEKRDELE